MRQTSDISTSFHGCERRTRSGRGRPDTSARTITIVQVPYHETTPARGDRRGPRNPVCYNIMTFCQTAPVSANACDNLSITSGHEKKSHLRLALHHSQLTFEAPEI